MVSILNPERMDSFDSWIRLGWCLHNIDYELLDVEDFSMNSPKYEDGVCEDKWCEMVDKGLSIGSLLGGRRRIILQNSKKDCR